MKIEFEAENGITKKLEIIVNGITEFSLSEVEGGLTEDEAIEEIQEFLRYYMEEK